MQPFSIEKMLNCPAPYRHNPTLPYMAKLTIGRMAKLYGLHRSTLHEAVAKGRVTAGLDGKGQKTIDLSEMIRVYGEPEGSPLQIPTPQPGTSPTPENVPLQMALQPLMEELQLLRAEIRDLRESLRLIEHKPDSKPEKGAQPPQASPTKPASWASLLDALD